MNGASKKSEKPKEPNNRMFRETLLRGEFEVLESNSKSKKCYESMSDKELAGAASHLSNNGFEWTTAPTSILKEMAKRLEKGSQNV